MQTFSPEQFKQKFGEQAYGSFGQTTAQSPSFGSQISSAFKSGFDQSRQGYESAVAAKNPLQLLEGSAKMTAGAVNAAFSPLAPVFSPIGAGIDTGIEKTGITDNPTFQRFASSKAGEMTSRAVEDVSNLNTIAGAVAGMKVPEKFPSMARPKALVGETIPVIKNKVSDVVSNQPAKIMQRVARIPKGAQAKFEKVAEESVGEYLVKRNIYGSVDDISTQLYDRFTKSKATADAALEQLPGVYKPPAVRTALDELFAREKRVSSDGAISPDLPSVKNLLMKFDRDGLTMADINEAKRLYERNIRTDYLKSIATKPEGVARATNIDTAIRRWQFNQAEKLGLKNLPAINKETQLSKALMDSLGKEYSGQAGNNAMSLTDWIMLSGGDPTAISGFLVKKTFSSKVVQSAIAKYLNKGNPTMGEVGAEISPTIESGLRKGFPQGAMTELPVGNQNAPRSQNFVSPNMPGRRMPDEAMTAKPSTPQSQEILRQSSANTTTRKPNTQGGFVSTTPFKNSGDLTTKILKDLEGKTTVSKQYLLDATNRGELKQVERDITRQVLDTMGVNSTDKNVAIDFIDSVRTGKVGEGKLAKGKKLPFEIEARQLAPGWGIDPELPPAKLADAFDEYLAKNKNEQINVQEFADKVKSELLPLKILDREPSGGGGTRNIGHWEHVSLPDEIKGDIESYGEHVFESPIKTSAGATHHFDKNTDSYFGHTRIEDMADNKTRRVIEVQSDLYQKGNLDKEAVNDEMTRLLTQREHQQEILRVGSPYESKEFGRNTLKKINADIEKLRPAYEARKAELSKLSQYNDPTAHFRMIREEIKKASQDGKTKLQFPTGETAMKIEGLGATNNFRVAENSKRFGITPGVKLDDSSLKVGQSIFDGNNENATQWIITDVLGDGKFKAVPKEVIDDFEDALVEIGYNYPDDALNAVGKDKRVADILNSAREVEQFDISGKVDTNNPIYKFYEKDVQKYLNKYGGKRIVDDKGVSWIEVPITKEQGKMPVEAFGKAMLNPLVVGAGVLGAGAVGSKLLTNKKQK